MTWTPDMPDRRSASDTVTWKSYVDRVFEEQRAQLAAALHAHDQRVATNQEAASERLTSLHGHIETIFEEKQRATEIAEREREKASLALRSEQHRSGDVAEREREKSAQALSGTLAQSIREGDERLREHIANQVEQIGAALVSVEGRASLRHDALRQQMDDRFQYTEQAVAKAEAAAEKRFASVNEFRAQLADQVATFLPREVADTQLSELRKVLAALQARMDTMQGQDQGTSVARVDQRATIGQVVAIITVVVALVAIAVGAYT